MVKLLGAALVALGSVLGGLMNRQSLRRELSFRRQVCLALELLRGEMEVSLAPVGTLFETVGERMEAPMGPLLRRAGLEMELVPGRPPVTALRIAMESEGEPDPQVRNLLLELGTALGRYDPEGQARALELCRKRGEALVQEAAEALRTKARASMTAAVCGALALIVMLL